jgi:hypothetical protein
MVSQPSGGTFFNKKNKKQCGKKLRLKNGTKTFPYGIGAKIAGNFYLS